jgi:hypothetical protein
MKLMDEGLNQSGTSDFTSIEGHFREEYIRLLDSQARFFNSQITVHVGYLVATVGILLTAFAAGRDLLRALLDFGGVLVCQYFQVSLSWCMELGVQRIASEGAPLLVFAVIFSFYFFGRCWPRRYSFKYLFGEYRNREKHVPIMKSRTEF